MPYTPLLLLLGLLSVDLSLQEKLISRTTLLPTLTSGPDLAPSPTEFNLTKRADSIPPNFCGWFSGSGYDDRWQFNDPSVTCFWNSDANFVGNSIPPQTACVGQDQLSTWSCSGSGCTSSVATCTGSQPYCVTFSYGSDYLSFVCSEEEGIEYQMYPYWSGLSDPIAFPIYTGSNGVSTGIQYPPGYPTASMTSPSSGLSSNSNSDSNSASGSSSSSDDDDDDDNSSSHHDGGPSIGAIVGGVVGGLVFIALCGAAIIIIVIRQRRKRVGEKVMQSQQPPQLPPQGPSQYPPQYPPQLLPQGSPQYPPQYPPPANPPMQTAPPQGPASPPAQQPQIYEAQTQYNKPELDSSRQQEPYPSQQSTVQAMQPIQPEYVSVAQRPSEAELDSPPNRYQAYNRQPGVASGWQHPDQRHGENIHEAP